MTFVRSPKQRLQAFLARVGIYERLRGSFLYDAYWRIADEQIIAGRSLEVEFYRDVLKGLKRGDLIIDIGANHGSKTDVFLRLGARVVAVEPDETNQEILRERFLKLRLFPKPVVVVAKAVSDRNTVETMWVAEPGSAKNTLSRKWVDTLAEDGERFGEVLEFIGEKRVETTTVDQLMTEYGNPFFVKIDVEGFEPHVLRGMHLSVPYLSFEVNLPEFRPEGLECVDLLGRLSLDGTFNYAVDCRRGLTLTSWLNAQDFSRVLDACDEKSIEVFWRMSANRRPT